MRFEGLFLGPHGELGSAHCSLTRTVLATRQRNELRLPLFIRQSKKEGSFRNLADRVEVECEPGWSERFGKNLLN